MARKDAFKIRRTDDFCTALLALTFDARGGVYIAGGISPRIVSFVRRSQFRARFEAKGRFRDYLKEISVNVITHPAAAFLGLTSIRTYRGEGTMLILPPKTDIRPAASAERC
jgi:hypothetical protein